MLRPRVHVDAADVDTEFRSNDWTGSGAVAALASSSGWKRLQLNGMAVDNSWDARAHQYESLYTDLVQGVPA